MVEGNQMTIAGITFGKLTTILAFLLLALFGLLTVNPALLQGIIGENLYLRFGLAIIAFLILFTDYWYPRIQAMVTGGQEMKFGHGEFMTFFNITLGMLATVAIAYPDAVVQFLGTMGLGSYATTIIYLATAFAKLYSPRNQQLVETTTPPQEPEQPVATNDEKVVVSEEGV